MIDNLLYLTRLFVFFYILYFVIQLLHFINKNFFRKRKNLEVRYGTNSWAIVTGATDGIGKAFCEELAKEGFNIILVSRSIEKLQKVAKEIEILCLKNYNRSIKTHTIEFDFSIRNKIDDYKKVFSNLHESFDISILVNNVGIMEKNYMVDVNLEYYKNMIDINILPQTLLTKIFTESLSKRTFRSAIIDLASVSSLKPLPYRALYAASKSYNDFLSRALSVEYENYNIDFLSVNPFLVESPLSKEKYNGITILTSNQTVQGSLNDLGHENYTHGHWLHKIQAYIWDKIPFIIIALIFRRK